MSRKGSNFIERYVDKFILAVVGLVCIVLLITHVFGIFGRPNSVEYAGRKFGPGNLDVFINTQAKNLENKLAKTPDRQREYRPKLGDFKSLFTSAIHEIDGKLHFPLPTYGSKAAAKDRVYDMPEIPEVRDVAMGQICKVAFVPTQNVTLENPYSQAEIKLGDIDLVTVEAKFDVPSLYKRFYESFLGNTVKPGWREEKYARPVFAAVQLRRQQLQKDGSWSDWQIVPRTKIDHLKTTFEFPEKTDRSTLSTDILMVQFNNPDLRAGLLQPAVYDFADSGETWLPPSIEKLREEQWAKEKARLDKKRREQQQELRKKPRLRRARPEDDEDADELESGRRRRWGRRRKRPSVKSQGDRRRTWPGRAEPTAPRGQERPEGFGRAQPERAKDNFDREFAKVKITEETDLSSIQELMFWAHDDSVEPGRTYRYSIRIGVFNPIAGTNWFSGEDKSLKDNVLLWSRFSDVTEAIEIPGRWYFFPRDVRQIDKLVTIQVCRYQLGRWYSQDFKVTPGQVIGKAVRSSTGRDSDDTAPQVPEIVDYTTGALLVDVAPVSDWSGIKLRRNDYFEILYTADGQSIEHLAINERRWPVELRKKYEQIKQAQRQKSKLIPDRRAAGEQRRIRSWEEDESDYDLMP